MMNFNYYVSIQSRMLESMASLIAETLDVPIILIFSKENFSRKLLFHSGIMPTGIPQEEIWEANASAHSKKVVFFEDLSKSKRESYSFDSILSQGIRFCCRLHLVSDQHRSLGELFLMDYSTHKVTQATIRQLESIADLASQILERMDVDRQSAKELEKSREFNQIVHEATLHSRSGGLSLNLESKTVFWFKSNNTALDLPRSFKLTYGDLVGETQTFDPIFYPQLLEFIEQVRLGISRMKTSNAEGTFVFGKEKKKYFTYSLHKVKEVIYLVFKDNTKQVEMSKELWDVQTLLQAEESYLLTGGWTLNLQNQKMSWTDNIRTILNLDQETAPSWELFVEKLKFCDSCGPSDIIAICMEPPGRFINEADVLLGSGIKKHILIQAELSQGSAGEKHLLGFLHDTTQSKLNKEDFVRSCFLISRKKKLTSTSCYTTKHFS